MAEYTKQELKELQKKSLHMAVYFSKFCKDHKLLCYLCGGGCIGAIRHKGFIPWDDDLDFFMPREDYNKLSRLWKNDKYILQKPGRDFIDHNSFITIRDPGTTLIKPYQSHIDMVHGIALDIFPLDGYAPSRLSRLLQYMWALIYSLYCTQVVPENHGKLLAFGSKAALIMVPGKKARYRIWNFAEKQMSKYKIKDCDSITELCAGPGYMKNRYPKTAFEKAVYKDFEETELPIPIGYDDYLKIAFGDYMKLPPENKRKPHHDALFFDLHKSYKEYKGKYYCMEDKK